MKSIVRILLLCLTASTGWSQSIDYFIGTRYPKGMEKLPEMSMANIGHNFCSGCSTYGAHEFKGVNMNYELVSNYRVNFTWEEELVLNPSTDSNEIVYSAYVMYSDKDQFEAEAKKLDEISKKNGEFWYGEKPVSLFDKPYNYKIKRIQFVGGNGAMVLYRGFKIRYFPH